MIPRLSLPIVLALSLAWLPCAAQAKESKPKPTPNHHHVTIESISSDSITVKEPGGDKTYKIASTTEITYDGQPTTVDQLQEGMRVQVVPDAVDETVAGEIDANEAPKDPPAKERH